MRTLLVALFALVVAPFSTVLGADMPLKAPLLAAPAEYNWSGIYAGANVGWAHNSFDWRYTNPSPATCCAPFSASQDDGIVGVHAGIQYQWAHIVIGVEASYNSLFDGKSATGAGCVAPNSATLACQINIGPTGTVGGRLGYAWADWLLYGTGGWAGGSVQTRLINPGPTPVTFDNTGATSTNGWYAGGGVEHVVFRGNWADLIAGLEYQHLDLGTQLHNSRLDAFSACPPGVNCRNVSATQDIVRFRLSVKINPFAPAGVIARY